MGQQHTPAAGNDFILPRRQLLLGLGMPIAAPAIVRASSLMAVKPQPAHFIKLAANSHDELVAALNKLVAAINWQGPDAGDYVAEAEREAISAIARATGAA